MACLYFTCPNTNRKAPTDVEMDVQGLRTHWRSILTFGCPHCDEMHDVCVREVYLAAFVDGLDPSGHLPARRYAKPQHPPAHFMIEASSEVGNWSGKHKSRGDAMLARLLNEMLLFSCMVAFVTGVVIAGATLFG